MLSFQQTEFVRIGAWFNAQNGFDLAFFVHFVMHKDPNEPIDNHFEGSISWANCAVGQFLQKKMNITAGMLHSYHVHWELLGSPLTAYINLLKNVDDESLFWRLNGGEFATYGELQKYFEKTFPAIVSLCIG